MAKVTRGTQGRKPESTLVTRAPKRKRRSRNWGAALVAASIAVAWTVGGLVMPSMASEPPSVASVHPEVNVSGGGSVDVGTTGSGAETLVGFLRTSALTSTKDKNTAWSMYGTTQSFGEYTAQFLPKSCIVGMSNNYGTIGERIAEEWITRPGARYYGAWVLFPKDHKDFSLDASTSRSADRSADSSTADADADSLELSLELDSDESEESSPVETEIPSTTGRTSVDSETPKAVEPVVEKGETQAKDTPGTNDSPSSSSKGTELSPSAANPGESKSRESKESGESTPSVSPKQSADDKAASAEPKAEKTTAPKDEDKTTAPASKGGKDNTEGAAKPGDDKAGKTAPVLGQDRAPVFSFRPNIPKINIKFDPKKPKEIAMKEAIEQIDKVQNDVLQELEEFASKHNLDKKFTDRIRTKLNMQFENMREKVKKILDEKYAETNLAGGCQPCNDRKCTNTGSYVPVGAIVLTPSLKDSNAWLLGQKTTAHQVFYLPQYSSTNGGVISAGGADSFCVEPQRVLKPGSHNIYTYPSGVEWAEKNPEKAEIVKALAWHYKQQNNPSSYGKYQNAIWKTVFGFPGDTGIWNHQNDSQHTAPGASQALISAAMSAYKNRVNVLSTLQDMHLDQISVDTAPDGKSKIVFLQLNDYNQDANVRRNIGDQVYLSVAGATDVDGKPVNRISLTEAEKGIHLKVANPNAFSIKFAGGLRNAEDAYFLNNSDTQAQVAVLAKQLTVSGSLKIEWGTTDTANPQVGTTLLVNGSESNPGGAEAIDISQYGPNDTITLTDSVTYSGLTKSSLSRDNYYLVGKLMRVRDGVTTEIRIPGGMRDIVKFPNGNFQGIFPVKLKVSDMKAGDKYYYEEYIVTSDPRYNKNEKILTGYGFLPVVVKHAGSDNPDQTVEIKQAGAKLVINKVASGETANAGGQVRFDVNCIKDNKTTASKTLYASAKGGAASVTGNGPATEISVAPGSTCQVKERYESTNLKFSPEQVAFTVTNQAGPVNASTNVQVGGNGHNVTATTNFTVPAGSTQVTVNTTNNYQADNVAKFILKKERRTNDGSALEDGGFRFTVNCDGYDGDALTLKKENNYQWEFTQLKGKALKAGTKCTVKETEQHNYPNHDWKSVDFSVQGTAGTPVNNGVSFVLPRASQATAVVTATNTYELKKGSLQVTKRVNTNAKNNPYQNQNYTFEADCFQPRPGDNSLAQQTTFERQALGRLTDHATWIRPVSVTPNKPLKLADKSLSVGTLCLVWERDVAGDVKPNLTWAGAGDDVTYTDGAGVTHTKARRVFITPDNGHTPGIDLTATNDFQVPYGSFKIAKELTGDAASDPKVTQHDFRFAVNCQDNTGRKLFDEKIVTVKPGQTLDFAEHTNQQIRVGSTCTIHEVQPKIKGIVSKLTEWKGMNYTTVGDLSTIRFQVPDKAAPQLTFTAVNEVKPDIAKFQIRKLVVPAGTEFTGNFKFLYECTDPNSTNGKNYTQSRPYGTQQAKPYIEVPAYGNSEIITVPAKSQCRVTEVRSELPNVKDNSSQNPLKYATLSFDPAGAGQNSGVFTPGKDGKEVFTVSATNTYTEKMTGFQFSKKVTGNNKANHAADSFDFGWSCQPRQGNAVTGSQRLADNGSHKVENLPVGTRCVLWENPATPKAGEKNATKWTVAGKAQDGKNIDGHANAVEFTVDTEGTPVAIEANNSFDIPDTSISIEKKVVKGNQAEVPADKEYRVNVSCVYPTDNAVHPIASNEPLRVGKTLKFAADKNGVKIPVGASCTVEETADSAMLPGHNLTVQLKVGNQVVSQPNTSRADNITVQAAGKTTVTIENTYNRQVGGFKLSKAVTGNGLDPAEALQANGGSYAFDYNCVIAGKTVKKGTVTVTPQNTAEVNDIPAGAKCSLTEKKVTAPTGFTAPQLSWKAVGTDPAGTVTIVENQKPTLEATNDYTPYQVKFNLRKVVNTDDHTQPGGAYGFRIDCGSGAAKDVVLNQDNNYTWESAGTPEFSRLSAKSCTITETTLPELAGYTHQSVSYQVTNATATQNQSAKSVTFAFPPKGDATVDVTATNDYQRQQGSIKVLKRVTVEGNVANPWANHQYNFEADCENPVDKSWNDHDSVTVGAGQEGVFQKGRWVGSVCHVWENTTDTADVTNQLTWEGDGETVASYTDKNGVTHNNVRKVTIQADKGGTPAVALTAHNHLTVQYGTFTLAKKLSGDALDNDTVKNTEFTFRVTCDGIADQTVKVRPGTPVTLPGDKMKVGTSCTVHEEPSTIPGVSSTFAGWEGEGYTSADNDGITVTIAKTAAGTPAQVFTANNQVNYDQGKFQIRKSVIPADATFDGNFRFDYTCEAPAGKTINPGMSLQGTVEVPAGQVSAEILVPAGSKCQVTEANPQSAPAPNLVEGKNPLKYQGTSFGQGSQGLTSQKLTVGKDQLVVFEATNTYVEQTTGFQFSKTLAGNNAAKHANNTFDFAWSCQARNGKQYSGSETLTPTGSRVVENLPVGTKCVLWENSFARNKLANESNPSTKWTVNGKESAGAKITDFAGRERNNAVSFEVKTEKDTVSITAENKFDIPGAALTVKKAVKADKLSVLPKNQKYRVDIACLYPTDGQNHTIAQGLELSDKQSKIYKTDLGGVAIPVGATCTVTEDTGSAHVDGHNWSVKLLEGGREISTTNTAQVTVPQAGTTVTIENSYQRRVGGFELRKLVDGVNSNVALAANKAKFEFTYDCRLGTESVKKGTITLDAQKLAEEITGIPAGAQCVVKEPKVTAPRGYAAPTVSWKLDGAESTTGTTTIAEGKTSRLEATNTYTPYQVNFNLKKLAAGSDGAKLAGLHTFQVTCGEGQNQATAEVTLSANGTETWDSSQFTGAPILSGEKCTITETTPATVTNYNWKSVKYAVTGVTPDAKAPEKGVAFTLPKTGNASVSITASNTYDHQLGSLALQKAVSVKDNVANPWDNKSYDFTVDCYQPGEGNAVGAKIEALSKTLSLKAGEPAKTVVSKAPVGTVCYVKETVANTPDVTNQLTWGDAGTPAAHPDGTENARRVVIAEDTAKTPALTVTALNQLEVHYGTFSLSKKLTGDAAADVEVQKTAFNFTVDCDGIAAQNISVKPGQSVTLPEGKMQVGSKCRVHEVSATITGVSSKLTGWEGSASTAIADNGIEVTIPTAGTPALSFTAVNEVTYDKASFQIRKVADAGTTNLNNVDFNFTYQCVANGKTYTQKTPFNNQAPAEFITVKPGATSAPISVPAGAKCRVTEVNPAATPTVTGQNPVNYDSTTFNPGGKGTVSAEFSATEGTVVTVEAKNIYVEQKTGFKFTKSVTGNNADNHQEKFTFGYSCQAPNGTKTTGTTQLGNGDPAFTKNDLPVGTECVLWEDSASIAKKPNETHTLKWTVGETPATPGTKVTDHNGASHDNGVQFKLETENKTVVIAAENNFEVPGTELTVKKTVTKDKNSDAPGDKKFSVNVTCNYPTDGKDHVIAQNLKLGHGETQTFTKDVNQVAIPVGAKCTVTEDEASAAVPGHAWKLTVKDPNNVKTAGVQAEKAKNTVELVNDYKREVGGFKLTKAVVGIDFAEATKANNGKFEFTYTCQLDGKTVKNGTGSLDLTDTKASVEVKDIPQGATCTLTEKTVKAPNGYAVSQTPTWKVGETASDTGVVTITEGQSVEVLATNIYTPYKVRFDLKKVVDANDKAKLDGDFKFQVTCGGKTQPVTLNAANNYTWDSSQLEGLKILSGVKCSIEETEKATFPTHNWKSVKYTLSDSAKDQNVTPERVSFTLPATGDASVTVTATNRYEHKLGSFQLQKLVDVADGADNPWAGKTYPFNVTCYEPGVNDQLGAKSKTIKLNLKADQDPQTVVEKVKVGTTCYVAEDVENTPDVTNTLTWDGAGKTAVSPDSVANTREVVITETKPDKPVLVKAVNKLKVHFGTFKLRKALDGDAQDNSTVKNTEFNFKVKCDGLAEQTLKVEPGATVDFAQATGQKVKVGTKCTVHEVPAEIAGVTTKLTSWNTGATTTADGGVEVTIPPTETTDLTFTATNQVTYDYAKFRIRKVVKSPVEVAFNGDFQFTYNCAAPEGKTVNPKMPLSGTVNVPANQDSAEITVPKGSKCSVTEADPAKNPGIVPNPTVNPVKYDSTTFDPEGKNLTSGEFTADGQTVKLVTATNTYIERMTGFQFSKDSVKGNNAAKHPGPFTFGYSCTLPGDKVQKHTVSLPVGKTESVSKLPVGTKCVLWENRGQPLTNEQASTKWTVAGQEREGKTIDGHPNAVDFTVDTDNKPVVISAVNTFDIPGTTLKIHKVVSRGDRAEVPNNKTFKVSVDCVYPTDNKSHVVAANIAIKNGETKEFTKDQQGVAIPVGASCTVTEDEESAKLAGHTWSIQMKDGESVISNTNQAQVTVPNGGKTIDLDNYYQRDFGAFKINKEVVAGSFVTQPVSYQFTYKCSDPKDASKSVDGDMTVSAKGTAFSKEIPVGYTCEIQETNPQVKGVKWTAQLSQNKFTIEKPKAEQITSVQVSATNNFSDATGKFQVKKVTAPANSQDPVSAPLNTKYNFEYECHAPGQRPANPTFNKFSITGEGTWTSPEIPSGSECSIRELRPSGELTGINADVEWSVEEGLTNPEATATAHPVMVEESEAFAFGSDGATAGKFTIGKNNTVLKLTATNKFSHADVELTLQKVAESTDNNGTTEYSKEKFAYWDYYYKSFGWNGWGGFVTRNHVDMKVTCGGKDLGTYQVPINGDVVKVKEKVAYGTKCTVAELDTSFNDYNMLFYGRWRHKVDMTATPKSGGKAIEASYSFDAVENDGEKAAITFDATDKVNVAVKMVNKWDCFASVTSELGTNHANAPLVDGVRQIDLTGKKSTDRVTLTDKVVMPKNMPGNRTYTVVGRLFDASLAGKLTKTGFNDPNTYLKWENAGGGTWDYVYQSGISAGTEAITLTYDVPVSLLEEHPNGIAAGVAVYNGGAWNPSCANSCGLIAVEAGLPQSQQVKPKWSGQMETQVKNPATNSNMLRVGKNVGDQKVTDTVKYTNVTPGNYDLYARIVAVDNPSLVIGEGTKNVDTVPAGTNGLASGALDNDQITVRQADLDAALQAGASQFVTYEFLLPKGTATSGVDVNTLKSQAKAAHVDQNDVKQQLFTPTVKTNATVGEDGAKTVNANAKGNVTVYDKVTYKNLQGGKKYMVSGVLHVKNPDGTDGGVLEGVEPATGTIDLSAQAKDKSFSGEITIKFTVPAEKLRQKTAVAFEEVKDGDILVAAHADITDEAQTIYSPSLGTTASVNPGKPSTATADAPAQVDMSDAKQVGDTTKDEIAVTVSDTVAYESLQPGSYVVYGELKRVTAGKTVAETDVTGYAELTVTETSAASGTVKVEFAKKLKATSGERFVFFEKLYRASDFDKSTGKPKAGAKPVASHEDPEDKAQTITVPYVPRVTTNATDNADGDKYVNPAADFTVKDEVSATGLIPGKTYDVAGELMIQDGTPNGKATGIKQTGKITAGEDGTGKTVLTFTVTAAKAQELGLIGKPVVAFETLSQDGKEVAVHHDINDDKQTVYTGGMQTAARDEADGNQTMIPGQKNAKVVDTVTFTGRFEKSHSYTLVGELHYADGTVVPGTNVASKPVQSDKDGVIAEQQMTFTVPAQSIKAGQNMVVVEKLFDGNKTEGKPVVSHEDLKDANQTITVNPVQITTTAYDGTPGKDKADPKDKNLTVGAGSETVTVYDQVGYEGLEVGKEYTVTGTLHYQADAILADGTQVKKGDAVDAKYIKNTPSVTFKAEKPKGNVIVEFVVDKAGLATAPVVVFESLKEGEVEIATHNDLEDESQIVHVHKPSIGTTATVDNGKKVIQVPADSKKAPQTITVKDEIAWLNLEPGNYTVEGKLMPVQNGKVTEGATPVATQTAKLTVKKGETAGTVTMEFQVPFDKVKTGGDFVAYEVVKNTSDQIVASHEDPADAGQTVTVGSLTTDAKDQADGDKFVDNTKDVQIVDVVTYSGLNPAKKYTLKGELMDKATKQSTGITSSIEVGPGTGHEINASGAGTFELMFTVKASQILGKTVVAFETLYQDGQEFLIHHDIDDEDQTVRSPQLRTSAAGDSETKQLLTDANSKIVDTVAYTNLDTSKKYVIAGQLMNKADEQPLGITAVKEFSPKQASGTEKVTFEVPAGKVPAGASVVVYEKLYLADDVTVDGNQVTAKSGKNPVASHEDINDEAQTVTTNETPKIGTVLSADGQRAKGSEIPEIAPDTQSLVDVVDYKGLNPQVNYRLVAQLVVVSADGKVTETKNIGTADFQPQASAGNQPVTIQLTDKAALNPNQHVVAYETLYRLDKPGKPGEPGEKVTEHKDPKDKDQTVKNSYQPKVGTTLTNQANGSKLVEGTGADVTLVDTVAYDGLTIGQEYTLKGTLQHKVDGKAVDTGITGTATFTPQASKGTQEVTFTVSGKKLAEFVGTHTGEAELVAYEQLFEGKGDTGEPVAKHEDINDAQQTVRVTNTPEIGTVLSPDGERKAGSEEPTLYVANEVKLTDVVNYYNLKPNTEYTLDGRLMGVDASGAAVETGVTGQATFTTPAAKGGATLVSGSAKVEFTVPRAVLENHEKLVAFEKLFLGGELVGIHEDPGDKDQSVKVKKPGVGTSAEVNGLKAFTTWEGVNAKGEKSTETHTVRDTVRLYNVEVGKTYALAGQVYDQSVAGTATAKPLARAAATVKVSADMLRPATEVEKTQYGEDVQVYEATMDLVVKRSDIAKNMTLVVFEQLWAPGTYKGVTETEVTPQGDNATPVATHNDPSADSQAVTVDKPQFGSLKLKKTVTGWDEAFKQVDRKKARYRFTVTCAQKGNVESFELAEDAEHLIDGIPLGDKCTITEDVQNAVEQTGLNTTVKYTETNGIHVESVENGKAVVQVGGTANGADTVANVEVVADNNLTHNPVITTNTQTSFGKTLTNGDTFTDEVTYRHFAAGSYVLHTYFVEMVKDQATGQSVAKKIDYLPSYVTDQSVKAEATAPRDGYDGTWAVNINLPDGLEQAGKQIVVWQDVYVAPQGEDKAKFEASLQSLKTGETSKAAKLVASHHETSQNLGDGYQWLRVSSNYGSFQVEKAVALGNLTDTVKQQLPKTFTFTYTAEVPAGKTLRTGTKASDTFELTVDPSKPAAAKSKVFEGFPVGTKVTITETGMKGTLPTGAEMSTTWATAAGKTGTAWTNGTESKSQVITITPFGFLQVKATNTFKPTNPQLATLATTTDGAKMLKPSEATPVMDTVTYSELVADREYWLLTELVYTDDSSPVLGADGQPLVRWTKVRASQEGKGTWVVDKDNPLMVPETTDPERDLVFFETLFEVPNTPGDDGTKPPDPKDPNNPPVVSHKDPKDPKQVVSKRPKLELSTVATIGKDGKTIVAGQDVKLADAVTYNGLKAGGTYTLVGTLVKKSDGKTIAGPINMSGLTASDTGSGTWTMEIPVSGEQTKNLQNGDKLVVFEKVYEGKLPEAGNEASKLKALLVHEDLEDAAQTVTVTKPSTPPGGGTPPPGGGTPPGGGGTPPPGGDTPPGGNVPPPDVPQPPVSPSTTTPPGTPPVSPSTTTPPPKPPVAPANTIPPARAKVPPTLARTGAQAAVVGVLSLAMIAAGATIGLLAARRKRESEK